MAEEEGYLDWDGNELSEDDFDKCDVDEGEGQLWRDKVRVPWDPRGPLTVPPTVLKGDVDIHGTCYEYYYINGCSTRRYFLKALKHHNPSSVILITCDRDAVVTSNATKNFVKGVIENEAWTTIIENINTDDEKSGPVEGYNEDKPR